MGLFDNVFGRRKRMPNLGASYWKTMTGYTPVFQSWGGEIYESELVRACIDAKARAASKLEISVHGSALPKLRSQLRSGPNPWMTWPQFLYRVYTLREMRNNAFIVPIIDEMGDVCGYFPVCPERVELVKDELNRPYVRFHFASGEKAAMELERVCILTKFQSKDDYFGETNKALDTTMQLIEMQKQGIQEGIRNGATFRFMARLTNFMKPEDITKERDRFNKDNLQNGSGGILLMPNTYGDIQQIRQEAFSVDADQMNYIRENVYAYFGCSTELLQNKLFGDAWSAFYEQDTEPFAIMLTDGLTRITFSGRQRAEGNGVFASSNRLQYMTNADKLNVSAQMADRGLMTRNEIRAIWNLPPFEGELGDSLPIRGEYYNAADGNKQKQKEVDPDGEPDSGEDPDTAE